MAWKKSGYYQENFLIVLPSKQALPLNKFHKVDVAVVEYAIIASYIKAIMSHLDIYQSRVGVTGLLITHVPSTSSVPSVRTSFVKFEICPVICDMPLPNHAIFVTDSVILTRTLVV